MLLTMGAHTPAVRATGQERSSGRRDAQHAKPYVLFTGLGSSAVPPLIALYRPASLSECALVQVRTVTAPASRSSSISDSEQRSPLRALQYATAPGNSESATSWIASTGTPLMVWTGTREFGGVAPPQQAYP